MSAIRLVLWFLASVAWCSPGSLLVSLGRRHSLLFQLLSLFVASVGCLQPVAWCAVCAALGLCL
jgi:hypothetical protein